MGIANVNLTDTFATWVTKTNQIILYAGQLNDTQNLIFQTTNISFVTTNAAYKIGRAHV